MRNQAIGIGGVITSIALFADEGCNGIEEKILIAKLIGRFEKTEEEARVAIKNAIDFGAVLRISMGNNREDFIRLIYGNDHWSSRIRKDVWTRELCKMFGVDVRRAQKIIKGAVDAGVLEETSSGGKKLLGFKK